MVGELPWTGDDWPDGIAVVASSWSGGEPAGVLVAMT
jgi:hypothetical protein